MPDFSLAATAAVPGGTVSDPSAADCPSHLLLDQRAAGELDAQAAQRVDAHVARCLRCQERVAARAEAADEHVVDLALLRALSLPADTRAQNAALPRPRHALRFAAAGAAAAAALAAIVVLRAPSDAETPSPTERAKGGGAQSALYIQDANGVRPLAVDDADVPVVVHAGDTLQVAVSAATDVFVAVLSLDAAGARSAYVPEVGGTVHVAAGTNVPLPRSTVLDGVLGEEKLAVFLCDHAIVEDGPLRAVIEAGAPPLGCSVERATLLKQGTP